MNLAVHTTGPRAIEHAHLLNARVEFERAMWRRACLRRFIDRACWGLTPVLAFAVGALARSLA